MCFLQESFVGITFSAPSFAVLKGFQVLFSRSQVDEKKRAVPTSSYIVKAKQQFAQNYYRARIKL